MSTELSALAAVDFQWASHIDGPWEKLPFHIPALQAVAARDLADKLSRFGVNASSASPLGVAVLGPTGSGKSHLLNSLRKAAHGRGQFFVLVDMTNVSNFEATVALGVVRSLEQPDADGRPQWRGLLDQLFAEYADATLRADGVEGLTAARPPGLINRCDRLLETIQARHPNDAPAHRDVVRAVTLLASNHADIVDLGESWLTGVGIAREDAELHGFQHAREQPSLLFRGLTWLMSLVRPTVLAIDQFDAAVAEHEAAVPKPQDETPDSRSSSSPPSALGISAGLARLLDSTRRTQVIVACREETWAALDRRSPISLQGRFEGPILLRPLSDPAVLRSLVAVRLQHAYRVASFSPPYPCYPFRDDFFSEMAGAPPREIYKRCDTHRRECLRTRHVVESGSAFPLPRKDELQPIQRRFEELLLQAPVDQLLADEDEPALGELVESAILALSQNENPTRADVDVGIDLHFPGRRSYEALHARVRLLFRADGDRERHHSFRFIQKSHDRAFQVRLAAAMTSAGIGRNIGHSRLAVLRVGSPPASPVSERLVTELRARGGWLLTPSRTDLAALWAIRTLRDEAEYAHLLPAWLAAKRPVSRISVFGEAVRWLFGDTAKARELASLEHLTRPTTQPPSSDEPMRRSPSSTRRRTHPGLGRVDEIPALSKGIPSRVPPSSQAAAAYSSRPPGSRSKAEPQLPLGERLGDGAARGSVEVPLLSLRNHAMVLAGEGSAKTALLKRLIEEAVLLGVPAIIVDGGNDLSLLGDERPSAPDGWKLGDDRKARLYHERSDVVIWTPGIHRGNPLSLQALPDLAKVADDPDELEAALSMVVASLGAIVAPASGRSNPAALEVLLGALRHFATHGGGRLQDLIAFLTDLPPEAQAGVQYGDQIARQMSEQLLVESKLNPLLGQAGAQLDPQVLFGTPHPGRTRVSVINLSGLPSERARQQFVDQLAMTLFSYIKDHPARYRPLLGLLVIDEARDFVPATRSVPGKESLLRLVPQARKYGLGILFATQAPKSVDQQLIASCATHFYGRVSSPAAIETVREQIRRRGGSGSDVATLMPNVFYAHTEGMSSPIRVAPLPCLSAHPPSPPGDFEIIQRAQRSREQALHV
jgi:energy-coupling factor transporter ATP-binding protein EcfA2